MEDRGSVPLILISPPHQIKHLEKLFSENDYFAFDSEKVSLLVEYFHNILPARSVSLEITCFSKKVYIPSSLQVWFLEEKVLPIVSSSTEEQKRHKILMKSPWEMLQSPVGSGGIISSLSSQHMPEILNELSVEYVRVSNLSVSRAH